ncbi:MAG: CoA-transferase subunit beta [Gemmatimonadaceae bacterium]|nr:CoA-transferase subunit beta [Gemmatimonadaceae bacterium]
MSTLPYTPDEMMTVAAARRLRNGAVCFVGIGLPSAACNLARLTHAPDLVLIYESGTVGTRPTVLPLSIGDGELAETARSVIPLPEIFTHYLQRGRVDVGFLGAAQIDRFGNLNSTVIGAYGTPTVRLPGAGGAPEIAMHAREVLVVMKQAKKAFVEQLDFRTSAGRPRALITDLGVFEPDSETRELTLCALFEGVTVEAVRAACGWPVRAVSSLTTVAPPTDSELEVLRALHIRTREAHSQRIRIVLPR